MLEIKNIIELSIICFYFLLILWIIKYLLLILVIFGTICFIYYIFDDIYIYF